MSNYCHENGKAYCKMLGMQWDTEFADKADDIAHRFGLSQDGWEVMVRNYAWKMKWIFTPANYSYWGRIKIACFFLNPFAKKYSLPKE